jgi:hypothetical protein
MQSPQKPAAESSTGQLDSSVKHIPAWTTRFSWACLSERHRECTQLMRGPKETPFFLSCSWVVIAFDNFRAWLVGKWIPNSMDLSWLFLGKLVEEYFGFYPDGCHLLHLFIPPLVMLASLESYRYGNWFQLGSHRLSMEAVELPGCLLLQLCVPGSG